MTPTPLPITRPYIGEAELAAVQDPLRSGWVTQGPYVAEFERRFAAFCGAEHAVATTSCTTALHVALTALGAGPGDEVIVPAFTWIATPNAVEYTGARPVFCDVRLDTYNLDPASLAAAVTPRTAGILPVHVCGRPADMAAVAEVAGRHDLWVVEDAACGFGARIDGVHTGTMGDAGCFSFHPRKTITTGEGGMVVTDDAGLAARARALREHGGSRSDLQRHRGARSFELAEYAMLGFNYRLTDMQAAVGCAQLDRAEWLLAERARLAERYTAALAGIEWLRAPVARPQETHGWQSYVCLFAPEEPSLANAGELGGARDELMAGLEAEGIAARPGSLSVTDTALYRERYGLRPQDFPGAHLAERLTLGLPLFPGMAEADQDRVVDALRRLGPGG